MLPEKEVQSQEIQSIPHNREAEEAVAGAILINPEVFPECRIHIQSQEAFFIHRQRWLWQAYEHLSQQGMPIDLLTVSDYLEKENKLNEIGGSAYLTSLVNAVPTSLNAEAYAKIVSDYHIRRNLIAAANNIATLAFKTESGITIPEVLSKASHEITKVSKAVSVRNVITLSKSLSLQYDLLEERGKTGILPGIPTGFVDLDKLLGGGAQNEDLLMIAGRPGDGKTSVLLQIAKNSACYRVADEIFYDDEGVMHKRKNYEYKRIVIFSLEMSTEQLTLRLISQVSGIDYQVLRSGKIPNNQISLYLHAIEELSNLDIVLDGTPGATPSYIRSRCEILNAEKKIDAVFVDSLNLMKGDIRYNSKTEEVDQNATELKNIAKELHIPVWCAHQMNRYIEHRSDNAKPKLSDLSEGGERPTDFVMFIWHKHDEETHKVTESEFCVEKHRNGPTGNIPIVFIRENTRFESAYVRTERFGNK